MVKRDLIRNIILLTAVVTFLVFLRLLIFDVYKASYQDTNTYIKKGDTLILARHEKPKYKDFVVYEVNNQKYLGRVIGMPKQSVTYMEDIFYLDATVEDENYLDSLKMKHVIESNGERTFTADLSIASLTDGQHQIIPDDTYLILNDNRQNLQDSRTFGLISKKQLKGVMTFRVFPLSDFGFMEVE